MKVFKTHFVEEESDITIITESQKAINDAKKAFSYYRNILENYILENETFFTSFSPIKVESNYKIIKIMSNVSVICDVGPMASVAGAVAYYAVKVMVEAGAKYAVVDNGGDVAMYIDRPLVAGIYTGNQDVKGIGFKFLPRTEIFGLCTSSATVGSSLSFGNVDAATVISKDVILADATATALGNSITRKDDLSIKKAMRKFMVEDIEGIVNSVGEAFKKGSDNLMDIRIVYDNKRFIFPIEEFSFMEISYCAF